MKIATQLTPPAPDACAHSALLDERIRQAIVENDGFLAFSRFMEMALYESGPGYYVAGRHKIGEQGDFVTAPDISPLFSQCMANQCAEALASLDCEGDILEFGAGNGTMAADLLLQLEQLEQLPGAYYILDVSPHLRAVQAETLQQKAPHLCDRVSWLDALPGDFSGVVVANEVLDAMPVTLFERDGDMVSEIGVCLDEDGLFRECRQTASYTLREEVLALAPDTGMVYRSELNPQLAGWLAALADCITSGVVLLADYGYTRSEYYHPDRSTGTLVCHYQHQVHDNYLWYPGLQDITANVDFTAVAEAAESAGFTLSGFTSQAAFLIGNQLEKLFEAALEAEPDKQFELARQVRMLTLPAEMGERFKVMALHKNLLTSLQGFTTSSLMHKL